MERVRFGNHHHQMPSSESYAMRDAKAKTEHVIKTKTEIFVVRRVNVVVAGGDGDDDYDVRPRPMALANETQTFGGYLEKMNANLCCRSRYSTSLRWSRERTTAAKHNRL